VQSVNRRSPLGQYRRPKSNWDRHQRAGLLFVLPSVLFVVVFFLVPLGMTLWMSLHDWPLLGKSSFSGLENYASLLSDSTFWQSLSFTTRYTLTVTPLIFVFAFALALLVSRPLRLIGALRTAYFLPVVIGLGASSLLWTWLFNDSVGVFSAILMALRITTEPVDWLGEPARAQMAVVVMVVWKTVGFTMMLLLVGLQAIPNELYEAARIDGAQGWAQTRFITLPLMRRTFALALVISVIGSFLAFDQFYIMTRGGPRNSTITVVYWIYRSSFTYFKLGYGAALSVVLLVILAAISAVQLRLLRDDTQY
jgi:multiple sugar transport system permease protein